MRRSRVKRGNLYPEQHQIGIRLALCQKSGSLEYAGRWLEHGSNAAPRGMIARQVRLVYKIRPIDLSHTLLFPFYLLNVSNCKDPVALFALLLIKDLQMHLQFLDFTTYFFPCLGESSAKCLL